MDTALLMHANCVPTAVSNLIRKVLNVTSKNNQNPHLSKQSERLKRIMGQERRQSAVM